MTAQSTKPDTKPKHKPYNRKYNRKRVIELAEQGISGELIAKDQNVAPSTISRFLASVRPQIETSRHYSNIKADVLNLSQLKKQTIEDIIIQSWIEKPELILSQDVRCQKEVLHTLQGGKTYDHQAQRLESGQSTQNHAVIVDMIHEIKATRGY